MRRRPAALRPPASSSSHQTGQPLRSAAHRVSVARTGEQASFRLKPMTSSLPTQQAGDADQSSRPDGYERNQACSLATTPKLPESLSDRYSFWEFSYPPTNCIAKPGGASRTSARPTIYTHLDQPLDIDRLAGIACLSPYHWHRIYQAMYGETLATTVRIA